MITALLASPPFLALAPVAAQEPAPDAAVVPARPELQAFARAEAEDLLALWRDLHAHPELSLHEVETAQRLAEELRGLGFAVTEGVGGTGVVGVLENGTGPTVLVRCDMDALPITEESGLDCASTVTAELADGGETGVMHACGHDVHMTVWVGTARFLAEHPESWRGRLLFVAQPAEELGLGARHMLEDGLYERFGTPDACLALHVRAEIPAGRIGSCPGYALANVDSVDVVVRGRGGHGSTPHLTKDPVVLAARIVMGLQTLVSREVSPLDAAVVTVGSIHGGTKHNIIPDEVKLQLTVRSYREEVRQRLLEGIRRTAVGEARAAGLPHDLLPVVTVLDEFTPAAYNDPELVARVDDAIRAQLGPDAVVPQAPVMGGEDFGRYAPAAGCPGYLFWLGVGDAEAMAAAEERGEKLPSVHTSRFRPDVEDAIPVGVQAMSAAVLAVLGADG